MLNIYIALIIHVLQIIVNSRTTFNDYFINMGETWHLGLTLNDHLNLRYRLNNVSRKISKTIGVLTFLKHTFPVGILKTIYNIHLPQLYYCLLSWCLDVRLITCNNFKAHTDLIFQTLQLLELQDSS